MSGQSDFAASAPLISPQLGTENPIVGATQAIGRAISKVSDKQHQIAAGTVIAVPGNTQGKTLITVVLDGAGGLPIQCRTLNGWIPPAGSRVLCLLYPPRGVVVLGQASDTTATFAQGLSGGKTYLSIQTDQNGVFSGILFLNDTGGSIVSGPMRSVMNAVNDNTYPVNSTTYVLPDASYAITLPAPASQTVTVSIYAQMSVGGAGEQGVWAPELRDGTSAGTILNGFVASDTYGAASPTGVTNGSVSRTTVFGGLNPASGRIWVGLKARGTTTTTVNSQRGTLVVHPEL